MLKNEDLSVVLTSLSALVGSVEGVEDPASQMITAGIFLLEFPKTSRGMQFGKPFPCSTNVSNLL